MTTETTATPELTLEYWLRAARWSILDNISTLI